MNSPGTQPFDHVTDVLVIGSGGGGMTAALAARTSGLQALVVEGGPLRWFHSTFRWRDLGARCPVPAS